MYNIRMITISIISLLICSIFFQSCDYFKKAIHKKIHIAVVGHNPTKDTDNQNPYIKAFNLYLKQNNKDIVNGKKIILDEYNDENDVEKAKIIAEEIVKQNSAVAVIGHWTSSCSIAASNIYKKKNLPVMTIGSTSTQVNADNESFFRMIYTNKQEAQYMMLYAKKILKKDQITIIYENQTYGMEINNYAKKLSKKLNIEIKESFQFDTSWKENERKNNLQIITKKIKESNSHQKSLIFIATKNDYGAGILKALKDAGIQNLIMGPVGFSTKEFLKLLKKITPEEKYKSGYYTNGLYATCPLIYDTSGDYTQNFKNAYADRYKEPPGWEAAYYYDAFKLIIDAIEQNNLSCEPKTIKRDRMLVCNYLNSKKDIYSSIKGASGVIYFNQRNAQRPVNFGVYKGNTFVSSLFQIKTKQNFNKLSDVKQNFNMNHMSNLYKTHVVYTGIEILNIIPLNDQNNVTYYVDFYLWFRFKGNINPQNIRFLDSLSIITRKIISQKTINGLNFYSYRINGIFKKHLNSQSNNKKFELGISFHHKTESFSNLIYVKDIIGMELEKGLNEDIKFTKEMIKNQVLNPIYNYTITGCWYTQDVYKTKSFGNIMDFSSLERTKNFSRIQFLFQIQKNSFYLLDYFPIQYSNYIFGIALFMFIIFNILKKSKIYNKKIWVSLLVSGGISILAFEGLLQKSTYQNYNMVIFLWCIFWPYILYQAINCFIWEKLEQKFIDRKYSRPKQLSLLIMFIFIVFALLNITYFIFQKDVIEILAFGGILAMILGWALKINISDLFSSILIFIDSPFMITDWVKIQGHEGKVLDVTLRSTIIQSISNEVIYIPNRIVTESFIWNYDYNDKTHNYNELTLNVSIYSNEPPDRVKKILLDAVYSSNGPLKEYTPKVDFNNFTNSSIDYTVKFYVNNYGARYKCFRIVWERILIHLRKANIPLTKNNLIQFQAINVLPPGKTETVNFLNSVFKSKINNNDKMEKSFDEGNVDYSLLFNKCDQNIYLINEGAIELSFEYNNNDKKKEKRTINVGVDDIIVDVNNIQNNEPEITITEIRALTKIHMYLITENIILKYINLNKLNRNFEQIKTKIIKKYINKLSIIDMIQKQ